MRLATARPQPRRPAFKARSPSELRSQRELQEALRSIGGEVERSFLRVIGRLRGRIDMAALTAAIRAGDLNRAERIVGASSLADSLATGRGSVVDRLTEALRAGGESASSQLPPNVGGLVGSLDLTNPEAVRYLRETRPALIREVTTETQEAVRQVLERGMTEGLTAPRMAREIRGLVGLTRERASHVQNFRRQLETGEIGGGTPPWDRRLSAVEARQARALFDAPSPDPAKVDALVARYAESLTNRRAKDIARTETHRAFTEGKQALWEQGQELGYLDPGATRRVWIVTPDERLRASHRAIPGMNPRGVGLNEPFRTPWGRDVMGPGDDDENLIGCRCDVALEFDE